MKKEKYLSISEFSKISDVSRKALIFYDKIGLFSPAYTAENGYRFYSHTQIGLITVINTMSELGIPLKEIKECIQSFTPENAKNLFEEQNKIIKQKIEHLEHIQDMITMRLSQINMGISQTIKSKHLKIAEVKEPIPFFKSEHFQHSKKNIPDNVMVDFYNQCEHQGLPFGYTVGYIVEKDNLICRKENVASNVCFRLVNARLANAFMPTGKYVVGYINGDYGSTDEIYSKIFEYIKNIGFMITGDAYEEYLLDELTTKNCQDYLVQVSVQIDNCY